MEPPVTVTTPLGWRARLAAIFSAGLSPSAIGWGLFAGGMIAVCPLPGLHTGLCVFAAWRFRLNIGLLLLSSNFSFGPMLALWAGLNAGLGRWMRGGVGLGEAFRLYLKDLEHVHGVKQLFAVLGHVYLDWVLGSLVLMPVMGMLLGIPGYLIARFWQGRRRARLPAVEPNEERAL
jgi:uncharacterized protein (DUF2062 family)